MSTATWEALCCGVCASTGQNNEILKHGRGAGPGVDGGGGGRALPERAGQVADEVGGDAVVREPPTPRPPTPLTPDPRRHSPSTPDPLPRP